MQERSRQEHGQRPPEKKSKTNLARNAYRFIQKSRVGWNVELDLLQHVCEDYTVVSTHYLNPGKMLRYLIEHHCEVVFGTTCDPSDSLTAFWKGYQLYHNEHEVFLRHDDLSCCIPVLLHGDEGKGKRRSNTTVVGFQAVLGMMKPNPVCRTCSPSNLKPAKKTVSGNLAKLRSNMKGHSYLQHWPIYVLAGTLGKKYKEVNDDLLRHVAGMFKELYESGIEVSGKKWFPIVIGAKGDLRWHSKTAKLTRGYEHKGRVRDVACCHQCLAGEPGYPPEDLSDTAPWTSTLFLCRPWDSNDPPLLADIQFDRNKPEWMYRHDVFHTLRLGSFRDFVGSTVFLWIRWDLFGSDGNIDIKLERAYGSFRLWLRAEGKTASLRSFTKQFFMYKNTSSYPWVNAKGSDVTLMVKWVAVAATGFLSENTCPERNKILEIIRSTSRVGIRFFNMLYDHNFVSSATVCSTTL